MTNSDFWCSPPEIADPLAEFFAGPVDVDPCSNDRSIIQARTAYTCGGLVLPWCLPSRPGRPLLRTCYENFPFSKGDLWTVKLLHELSCGNVREHVRLSMFACSTRWWADMCKKPQRNPRILALRRLEFLDPFAAVAGQTRVSCRFEPALVYFGRRCAQFERAFAHLTRWTAWGR